MKKKFNLYMFVLLGCLGLALTACDDDDDVAAKAVLASASNLNFDAVDTYGKIITVYSDAEWICEHPDWVTVEPERGSGTTEVRIRVSDNMRDGAPDNPRKADIVFRGMTKESEAHVILRQSGDLFRDVQPITIEQMERNEEESVAILSDLMVAVAYDGAFVATDGKNNVYVQSTENVTRGQAVTVYGTKAFDIRDMSIVIADHLNSATAKASLPEPVDITADVDSFKSVTRTYVTLSGKVDGKSIVVDGATNKGNVLMAPDGIDFAGLNGHGVTVKAFYAGTAAPVVNLMVESVEDHGLVETIYFTEDFEWLAPWTAAGNGSPCGDTVGKDDLNANSPQITSPKVDGVSALKALESKGYVFHRVTTKTAGECIYLNSNYLKFGKTSYQAGLSLPSIKGIPEGENLILSFDWCPMRQGSGKVDPVNLVVIVKNGADEKTFEVPTHGWANGHTLEWINAKIDLSGLAVDQNTVITIRQTEWPAATANRWFLDNIKIVKK